MDARKRAYGSSGLRMSAQSAPQLEKVAQQGRGFALPDAAIDLGPVQAGRRGEIAHAVLDRAALGIGGAVIDPSDAGERDRRRAHGAGLERHVEIAVGQPLAAQRLRRAADRHHLGMRGRIAIGKRAIAGLRDQIAVAHDHAADRHLAGVGGRVRLVEREIHESMRRHVPSSHRFEHQSSEKCPGAPLTTDYRSLICYHATTGAASPTMTPMRAQNDRPASGERIAKAIARAGLCSRREAETWIAAGRVAVNGEVIASPARNVTAGDRIAVDGEPLPTRERTRLFLYHKPRGLLTTHADPGGRPTIFTALPVGLPRLISVGRLDLNTEGLLLLTNDGSLARTLELPATGWLRRYRVRAHGRVGQGELDRLRAGITIDGIRYGSIEATVDRAQGSNVWLTFAIREGKNREVKNVLGDLGLEV